MWMDGEQLRTGSINASQNKRSTDVALVPAARRTDTLSARELWNRLGDELEQSLFEHSHSGDDTGLATS